MAAYSLHNLPVGSAQRRRNVKRLGRGHGSGRGKTAGRGTKGQRSRTGGRGGLKRLGMKRTILAQPKLRGFKSIHPKSLFLNVCVLEERMESGATVSPKKLVEAGLVEHTRYGVKLLGRGELTKKFTVQGVQVSAVAKAKIEAAGGQILP
ncbi:MAG: 50S ribosomal protein L15 [Candidatus Uhrbacteria bacterium]